MNMMYELIIAQKKAKEAQAMSEIAGLKVKPKYEYDSDEDTTEGTWEHKKRMMEMNATKGRVSVLSPFSPACNMMTPKSRLTSFRWRLRIHGWNRILYGTLEFIIWI